MECDFNYYILNTIAYKTDQTILCFKALNDEHFDCLEFTKDSLLSLFQNQCLTRLYIFHFAF